MENTTKSKRYSYIKLTSQVISGNSRLRRHFNETSISTSSVPSLSVLPVIFSLKFTETVVLASEKRRLVPSPFKDSLSLSYRIKFRIALESKSQYF